MLGSQNNEFARNGCPRARLWATPARFTMTRCVGYWTMPMTAMAAPAPTNVISRRDNRRTSPT